MSLPRWPDWSRGGQLALGGSGWVLVSEAQGWNGANLMGLAFLGGFGGDGDLDRFAEGLVWWPVERGDSALDLEGAVGRGAEFQGVAD